MVAEDNRVRNLTQVVNDCVEKSGRERSFHGPRLILRSVGKETLLNKIYLVVWRSA